MKASSGVDATLSSKYTLHEQHSPTYLLTLNLVGNDTWSNLLQLVVLSSITCFDYKWVDLNSTKNCYFASFFHFKILGFCFRSLPPGSPRCSAYHLHPGRVGGIQLPRGIPGRSSRAVCVAMGEEGRRHGRIFPLSALYLWWPSDSDKKRVWWPVKHKRWYKHTAQTSGRLRRNLRFCGINSPPPRNNSFLIIHNILTRE